MKDNMFVLELPENIKEEKILNIFLEDIYVSDGYLVHLYMVEFESEYGRSVGRQSFPVQICKVSFKK